MTVDSRCIVRSGPVLQMLEEEEAAGFLGGFDDEGAPETGDPPIDEPWDDYMWETWEEFEEFFEDILYGMLPEEFEEYFDNLPVDTPVDDLVESLADDGITLEEFLDEVLGVE